MNLKLCWNVHSITLASTKIVFLWQLKSFHRLIMGKVKVGLYFYLSEDILTEVLQNCSLSSPHVPNKYMNFVQTAEFDWLPWQPKG